MMLEATSKLDSEKYMIKMINKKNIKNEKKLTKMRQELEIMKSIYHPNILKLYDYFENVDHIISICEYVPMKSELFDKIVDKGSFGEAESIIIIRQILEAVSYLHNRNIVHRDLKPENIIFLGTSEKDMVIKIAGFEISTVQNEEMKLHTQIGTPCYIAPEIILCDGYDKEVDMWGIGIITYMLLAGYPPFYVEDGNEAKLIELVVKLGYDFEDDVWDKTSETAKEFIKSLLVKIPQDRLTVEQAKTHPWIST